MRETQLTFSLSFQHSFSHIFLSLTFFKHKLKRDFIENDYIYIQVYFSLNVYSRAFIITSSNYTSSTIKKKTIKEKVRHLLRRMPHSFLTMNHTKLLICLIPNNREGKKKYKNTNLLINLRDSYVYIYCFQRQQVEQKRQRSLERVL